MGSPVLHADSLGKLYRLYNQPQDRLKELLFGRLGRRYSRDFWALRDVSFELARGERLGVIGRNGSGKSTLLQMLAGTLTPSTGRLSVSGRIAALLELGSGFNPDYTGRENVFLNASILGLSQTETEARFDSIAAFADIGDFLEQPVRTYSSGMFVRLAFAVASSVDADLLLVDEALAVGDVFFTQKCYRHMRSLVDRGAAVVLVSHDMSTVSQFCSSVLLLDGGRPLFQGDTATGIRRYFSLQRAGAPVVEADARGDAGADRPPRSEAAGPAPSASVVARASLDWPTAPEAFVPLDRVTMVGEGARCTAFAITDQQGRPTRLFEIGETAVFHFAFELDADIEAPIGGIEIFNERDLIVHGRNTLQCGLEAPASAARGSVLRYRRRVTMALAPGEYTVGLGLATMDPDTYARAAEVPYDTLAAATTTLLVALHVASFSVHMRSRGQALPHHGLCDLPGDMLAETVPADGRPGALWAAGADADGPVLDSAPSTRP